MRKILAYALAIVTLVLTIPTTAVEMLAAESSLSLSEQVFNMTPEELDAFIAEDPDNYQYLRQGCDEYIEFTVEPSEYEGQIIIPPMTQIIASGATIDTVDLQSNAFQRELAYDMAKFVASEDIYMEVNQDPKVTLMMQNAMNDTLITPAIPVYDIDETIIANIHGIVLNDKIVATMVIGAKDSVPPLIQYVNSSSMYTSFLGAGRLYYSRKNGITTTKSVESNIPDSATYQEIRASWNAYLNDNPTDTEIQSLIVDGSHYRLNINTPDFAWYKLCTYTVEGMFLSVIGRQYDPVFLPVQRPLSLSLIEERHDAWVNSGLGSNNVNSHRPTFQQAYVALRDYVNSEKSDSTSYGSAFSDTGNSSEYSLHKHIIDTYEVPTFVGYKGNAHIMLGIGYRTYTTGDFYIVRDTDGYDGEPANYVDYKYNNTAYDYVVYGVYPHNETSWGTSTLRVGNSGTDVIRLRYMLNALYYNVGNMNSSTYDATLEAAVKAFQEDHGLTADGVVGTNTYRQLRNAHIMRFDSNQGMWRILNNGKRGDDVAQLQFRLYELGYLETNSIDGIFGNVTREALIEYQLDHPAVGTPDGVAGAATLSSLYSNYLDNPTRYYRRCETCQPNNNRGN